MESIEEYVLAMNERPENDIMVLFSVSSRLLRARATATDCEHKYKEPDYVRNAELGQSYSMPLVCVSRWP